MVRSQTGASHVDPAKATDKDLVVWIDTHVRVGHGPLGAAYPRSGWDPQSPGVQEGDSLSFLHLVSGLRGLNDPEKPDQGG